MDFFDNDRLVGLAVLICLEALYMYIEFLSIRYYDPDTVSFLVLLVLTQICVLMGFTLGMMAVSSKHRGPLGCWEYFLGVKS